MYTQRFKIAFERLMRKKITNSVVSKLSPAPDKRQVIIYDTEVAGFGVRAMASGVKTFIFLNVRKILPLQSKQQLPDALK